LKVIKAICVSSFFYLFVVQFAISQTLVTPLLDSLSVVSSESEKSRISLKIALELSDKDWERSEYYMKVAEESALASDDPQVYADYLEKAGDIFSEKQAYDIGLKFYLKAYDFYKDTNLPRKYIIETNLAILYAQVEGFDEALVFFRLLYQYHKQQKDSLALAKSLNNIGNLYFLSGVSLDSSIVYFQKALKIEEKANNNGLYFHLHTNLGRVFSEKEQYEKSKLYFNKAFLALREDHSPVTKAWFYNAFSEFYLKQNKVDSSIYYANKSFQITDSLAPYTLENLKTVKLLYNAYKLNKEFEKATVFFDSYSRISDSVNIEEKRLNVEKILIQENYKSKEKIRALNEGKRRLNIYIVGLSFLILILILFILLVRNRAKLKNIQLEKKLMLAKRKELNASLETKNNELIGKAMTEIHRTEIIDEILQDLKNIKLKALKKETKQDIAGIVKRLEENTNNSIWKEFQLRFEQVHESFYKNLLIAHPDLTSKDKRLCALLILNLTSKEISQITGQSFKSVENSRTRLRKKLNITNVRTDLAIYLSSFN
jgi:tetratricopeptide (TPR) repeat protein/DNA-binding CsgD family transcriptional regulator